MPYLIEKFFQSLKEYGLKCVSSIVIKAEKKSEYLNHLLDLLKVNYYKSSVIISNRDKEVKF